MQAHHYSQFSDNLCPQTLCVLSSALVTCKHIIIVSCGDDLCAETLCVLSSATEQRFMQASMAAQAGKSIISDEEYDELKQKLRNKNSKVVSQVYDPPH